MEKEKLIVSYGKQKKEVPRLQQQKEKAFERFPQKSCEI